MDMMITEFEKRLLKEKEKLTAENAEEEKISAVMRDIEDLKTCKEFDEKYGEIRIPCSADFTLIIDTQLRRRDTGVRGYFVLNPEIEDFLYNNLLDSQLDIEEWFDELCQNMIFGLQDAPVLTQNISMAEAERTIEYYKGKKAKKLYAMIDSYLQFIVS
jgi:hypothetical protein